MHMSVIVVSSRPLVDEMWKELEESALSSNQDFEGLEKIKNMQSYVDKYCWITGLYVKPESYGAGP